MRKRDIFNVLNHFLSNYVFIIFILKLFKKQQYNKDLLKICKLISSNVTKHSNSHKKHSYYIYCICVITLRTNKNLCASQKFADEFSDKLPWNLHQQKQAPTNKQYHLKVSKRHYKRFTHESLESASFSSSFLSRSLVTPTFFSSSMRSPLWCICSRMSQPPTNSLSRYT